MAFIQRTGQDTILRSDRLPAVDIQIDPEFKYAGATSFILYDICHAEQHHFVVANAERRILRQLWFQFEGYLENNTHIYDYSGLESLQVNGLPFVHNTYPINIQEVYETRPTSDYAHVIDFLKDKGYLLAGNMISHRMVWLDTELRNELMIIYWEAVDMPGYSPSDAAEWAVVSRALVERSRSSFRIL